MNHPLDFDEDLNKANPQRKDNLEVNETKHKLGRETGGYLRLIG